MSPLTVVCWKWTPPAGYRSVFGPDTVNVLARMVRRHYRPDVRFACVTDDAAGLDPDIEVIAPQNDFAQLPSPHGGRNPSCYRRLRLFHPDAAAIFGPRVLSIDLDVVLTGDVRPLWDREEDFVAYGDTHPSTHYNGSMMLLRTGARPQVWNDFDPARSPELARLAHQFGSDQGWISYKLGPNEAKWTKADGVYSYRNEISKQGDRLPADARVVVFHGNVDPWSPAGQQLSFVREHYR